MAVLIVLNTVYSLLFVVTDDVSVSSDQRGRDGKKSNAGTFVILVNFSEFKLNHGFLYLSKMLLGSVLQQPVCTDEET